MRISDIEFFYRYYSHLIDYPRFGHLISDVFAGKAYLVEQVASRQVRENNKPNEF